MRDEQSIVCRAQEGDGEAFSALYEEYFDRVYRYVALKVGNRSEAEDIAQQVFVKAFEGLPGFRWRGMPFSSWLFRIAHNQTVDWYRRRGKMAAMPLEETSALSDGPENAVEQRLALEQVALHVRDLTRAQREVLSLRFGADMSTAEVARTMGRSEGAVKALQHSAIAALRRKLDRESNGQD